MEIIRGLHNIREHHKGAVVTIGNFDGVHLGHQMILEQVDQKAESLETKSMLICFEPQPKEFFDLYKAPARLTRFREKVELLAEHGISRVLCLKFNEEVRSMSSARFISLLVDKLEVKALFVGDDFKFGNDREGNFSTLEEAGIVYDFSVYNMYTLDFQQQRVSSTRIRECLASGQFELAEKLLGHPYSISGKVIYGRQLGRTLGVPTANIQLNRYVAPISGVFACNMFVDNESVPGVANVGVRPTVDDKTLTPILEVHLLNFGRSIYGKSVKVVFLAKIRDEKKFENLEALKFAINSDIRSTEDFFRLNPNRKKT
ncbi:MAG: bifunctional riboflavin kinase/FMN adenylyltransferase [Gammaproteobacteria bacterium]|nr:bifunctional riboflavin kinase/FMN adenylyltransferase [Gammaproteobacteria bacterium]